MQVSEIEILYSSIRYIQILITAHPRNTHFIQIQAGNAAGNKNRNPQTFRQQTQEMYLSHKSTRRRHKKKT